MLWISISAAIQGEYRHIQDDVWAFCGFFYSIMQFNFLGQKRATSKEF